MVGIMMLSIIGTLVVIFSLGVIFYITMYSIKYDTEDKVINIILSSTIILLLISGLLIYFGI
ncbi:hypothetical protein CPT_Maine_002 [Staphylococcus phage Maine]|nr:hypothetical protein CPT_Maine_002 [Staphylococcus phage Maine]